MLLFHPRPNTIQPQLCPVFLLFPTSFPPSIQVRIWEWRLFHEASVEHQSISCIWRISLDWDKLGSRTKRCACHAKKPPSPSPTPTPNPLPPPIASLHTQSCSLLSPTQLGRDLHSSLVVPLYLSPLLSIYLLHLSILIFPNRNTSQRGRGWFKPQVNSPGLCHIYFSSSPHCDLWKKKLFLTDTCVLSQWRLKRCNVTNGHEEQT